MKQSRRRRKIFQDLALDLKEKPLKIAFLKLKTSKIFACGAVLSHYFQYMSGQLRPDPARGETGGKTSTFFLKVFQLCEFLLKSLQIFFVKIRSSRDLFKNAVLDQNFDFRSPHTPLTLGNFQNFGEFPLISHCKLY